MTMRNIGAALILLGCLCAGCLYTRAKRRHMDTLRELSLAMELMEGELGTRVTPMPELTVLLSERVGGQAGAFFASLHASMEQLGTEEFSALWCSAARKVLFTLNPDELREFSRLGFVLGRYELEKQLAAIQACTAALRTGLHTAESAYPGQRRLGLGLPAAAGALLVIALF